MNYLLISIFGAVFGSFFYTLAYRFIDGSFAKEKYKALIIPSRCPSCGQRINPLYLIPVIGFLILKGKCRKCAAKISLLYPVMEILFGLLAVYTYSRLGFSLYSVIVFFILGLSVSVSIVDIKILKIPDSLLIVILLLCIYPVILNNSLKDNLYGFLIMSIFFVIVLLIFPGGFGGGDAKFAAVIGVLLGLEFAIIALETSLITGSLTGIVYAIKSGKGFRIKMPFAPFLAAGLFVALFYGRDILLVYYDIFS